MSIQDQLEEMENLITANTAAPSTDVPGTDAPGTESAATEAPGTEAPGTESPATEAPGTSAPATDAPATEVPNERMSELERENEELRKKLADKHEKPATKAPATSTPSTEAPLELSEIDFIGDADVRDITDDKGALNKLLNKVFTQGVETVRKTLGEGVLRRIPDIVKHNITVASSLKKMTDKFYEDNEDLKPWKKVVGAVYEEVHSNNPDLGYDEVMKKVGDEVRSRLELQKKAPNNNDRTPPRLPRKRGRGGRSQQQSQPNTDPLLSELDAMDAELNQ